MTIASNNLTSRNSSVKDKKYRNPNILQLNPNILQNIEVLLDVLFLLLTDLCNNQNIFIKLVNPTHCLMSQKFL